MVTVENAASVEISEQPLLQQDNHFQTTTHSPMESDDRELEFIPQSKDKDKVSIRGLVVSAFYLGALFCIITQGKLNLNVGIIPSLNANAAGLLGFFFVMSWAGLLSNGISLLAVLTSCYGSLSTAAIGASSSASTSKEPPPPLRASASQFLNSFHKYYPPYTPSESEELREDKISIRGLALGVFYLGAFFCIITQVKLNLTFGIIPSLNAAGLLGFFFVMSWAVLLSNGISLLAVLTSYYGSIGASSSASTSKEPPPPSQFLNSFESFDEYHLPYMPSDSEDSGELREEAGIPDLEDEEYYQQEAVKEVQGNHEFVDCSSGGGKVSHSEDEEEGPRDKSEAEHAAYQVSSKMLITPSLSVVSSQPSTCTIADIEKVDPPLSDAEGELNLR